MIATTSAQQEKEGGRAARRQRSRDWLAAAGRYGEAAAALASGVLMAAAWAVGNHAEAASVALYLLAYVTGGFVKAKEGLRTLVIERDLDVNLLMLAAAIGAASIGYWTEGAALIFIFALSGALESYTMDRSRRDIASLMEMKPETATLYKDGAESEVPVDSLAPGDMIVVRPGERIAADGIVADGASDVNEASMTGEPLPVDKSAGSEVFAGTLNGRGALFVEVTRPGESTLFAKIIRLVQEAQSEKPASQLFMERFERIYARAVIGVCLLLIAVPPLMLGRSWDDTLYKAMVFLVVASPCALVASIMPAVLSAISGSARSGLLFKGGAYLEHLARVKVVAFDKTGTLTAGRPTVTDVIPLDGRSEADMLRIAASLESLSEHPLARAIVDEARARGIEPRRPSSFAALTGQGVEARLEGDIWRIGKPEPADVGSASEQLARTIARLEAKGKTVTVLRHDRGAAGIIAMRDELRPDAARAIEALRKLGIATVMLTGDRRTTAEAIAREAGIDRVCAGLLPEDKVNIVKELRREYGQAAMVGDGVNDAPALATATVGIAIGAGGSDAALDTANLVLLDNELGKIAGAIALGRRTSAIVKQNIAFALGVIVLLLLANFTDGLALPLGVVGHEGSTILVILNGLRLLRQPETAAAP